jgi:RNA polymerase sigma-70 factor (ECF subfamily)
MSDPTTRPSLLLRPRNPMDGRAWGEFIEIYGPLIHRLARRRGLQDDDAADLAQDVFRAVAGAIERYDTDPARGSFRGWLSTIAGNLIVNLLDALRRHARGIGDTEVRRLLEEQPAPDSPYSAAFDDEFTEATWQAFWKTRVEVDAADVELDGASSAVIRVTDLLGYQVNSASHLEYLSEPTIKEAGKAGASSVSQRP